MTREFSAKLEIGRPNAPPHDPTTAGAAALAICESTLIALTDLGIISGKQERALLEDAADSHRRAAATSPESADMHLGAAAEIQRFIDGRKAAWKLRD